jgi:prepilin peptidase CpaA
VLATVEMGVLLGMVGAAAAWDLSTRRIPNALVGSGLLLALALALSQGGLGGLGHALAGAALGFALLILPFARGWMGGGDLKLTVAIGAFVGPMNLALILLIATALHGLVSLATLLGRSRGWLSQAAVPLGLSLALATVAHVAGFTADIYPH